MPPPRSDPLWRLPLWRGYEATLTSAVADLTNNPNYNLAGAITAALFLNRFVEKAKSWVHLDIAGLGRPAQARPPRRRRGQRRARALCAAEGTLWPIRRLTPARPDLAAAHLKGKVEAARFVEGETCSVIARAAPRLRAAPSDDAAQDSELLFGESFTVYERKDGWAWGQAASDHYVGYVREAALGRARRRPMRR